MKNKILGVGINDADYVVNKTSKGLKVKCPYYYCWLGMLERCYSKSLHKNRPDYIGGAVCDEWLLFSSFRVWMVKQDWKGKQLDKDVIKPGNRLYSPELSVFVNSKVNGLLKKATAIRGNYPIGVSKHKVNGPFEAKISIDGKQIRLGFFKKANDAHDAWRKAKKARLLEVANEQVDDRVKNGLILHANLI